MGFEFWELLADERTKWARELVMSAFYGMFTGHVMKETDERWIVSGADPTKIVQISGETVTVFVLAYILQAVTFVDAVRVGAGIKYF